MSEETNDSLTSTPMPSWVPRAIVMFWFGVIVIWVLQRLFQSLSGFLLTILISFFFSFALEPAVNWLERRGMRRGIGTILMFGLVFTALLSFGWVVGSVLAEQTKEFVVDAPIIIDNTEDWLRRNFDGNVDLDRVRDRFLADDGLGQQITGLADNVVDLGTTVIGLVFDIFTIALFTYYLTADGPRLRRTICSRLKPARQRRVLGVWDLAIQKTGGYILSRSVLALVSSIATFTAFSIIGVPFPLALAAWVGVLSQFLPVVGVYIAGSLPLVLTVLESPTKALWAFLFMLAYQQVENYLLAPRIDSRTLKIHPAVSFGSVLVGASVLGPVGALLALPAAATAQGIMSATGERYAIEEGPLTRLGPPVESEGAVVSKTLPKHDLDGDPNNDAEIFDKDVKKFPRSKRKAKTADEPDEPEAVS